MRGPILLSVMLLAAPASASLSIGFDVGAGYWGAPTGDTFPGYAQFDAHLSVRNVFTKFISLGVRPGFMVNVAPGISYGVPVDLQFRVRFLVLYAEALGGVAYLIRDPQPWRPHGALGVGLVVLGLTLGLEAGYLMNGFHGGLRIGFSI